MWALAPWWLGAHAAADVSACTAVTQALQRQAASKSWEVSFHCTGAGVAGSGIRVPETAQTDLLDISRWVPGGMRARVRWMEADMASIRTVTVQGVLRIETQACVAASGVRPGDEVTPQTASVQRFAWPLGAAPVDDPLRCPHGRARRNLAAGQRVTSADVLEPDEALRGDVVTLTLQEGGLQVQTSARLLTDARNGQWVKVQPLGRAQVLEGRYQSVSRTVELK